MERLTQTSNKGGVAFTFDLDITCERSEIKKILKVAEKLKNYEDAEEQGLLLRFPCKVGDTIYIVFHNHTIGKSIVDSFKMIANGWAVKTNDWSYLFTDFGETVFLTREEAEAKLKEMECSYDRE